MAGIGNAWLRDDGFGGEVARRLAERELPSGVSVFDFGTGGLDLAYEVMRGYDALVLVDVEPPGRRARHAVRDGGLGGRRRGGIEDGATLDPHGMDPQTVLRFISSVGGWPGKVVVVACEPAEVEDMGIGLTEPVAAAVDPAVELVLPRWPSSAATRPTPTRPRRPDARAVARQRDGRHRRAPRRGPPGDRGHRCASGTLRQVVPDSLDFYFEIVARGTLCEGARLEQRASWPARLRCEVRPRVGARAVPASAARLLVGPRLEVLERQRVRGRIDRGRGGGTASHQGEGRRGCARRQRHDRARPTARTSIAPA